MTITVVIAAGGFLVLTVVGFLCYIVGAAETDGKPYHGRRRDRR